MKDNNYTLASENRHKREPYLQCIAAGEDAIDKIKICVERCGFENLESVYNKEDIDDAIYVLIYYFNTCRQREQKLMEEES